jgi:NADPH:quinone reductase-like Zn-dependent oxidoreductase
VVDYKLETITDVVASGSVDCVLDTVGDARSVLGCIKKGISCFSNLLFFFFFPRLTLGGHCVSIAASPTNEGLFPTDEDVQKGIREPVYSPAMLSVAASLISAPIRLAAWYAGVSYSYMFVKPNREDLNHLAKWILHKQLVVHIQKRYDLDDANLALEELAKGGVVGKLLINVE